MDEIILRNLFKNVDVGSLNDPEKVLTFYRLAIELERTKEPEINEFFEYPINFHRDERIILIDFPCNEPFRKKFELNRNRQETKFPSDLYAGLKIRSDGAAYRLLNLVIDFSHIKDIRIEEELLPLKIADFEVNLKEASRLELLPETIDNINAGIKANPTWKGVLDVLHKEVSEDVSVDESIFLALSAKSIELSQIYSELSNKRLQAVLASSSNSKGGQHQFSLLESFLLNQPFENEVDDVDPDSLICVTKLDDSQREAVVLAMNSRVSVITGAPGTGKTQVIENILTNALIHGKKVLVASKNNKAVENVKDRFSDIDSTGYFLRFGSKQVISSITLPAIERLKNEIERLNGKTGGGFKSFFAFLKKEIGNYLKNETEKQPESTEGYDECKGRYEESVKQILQGKKAIVRIRDLGAQIQLLSQREEGERNNLVRLEDEHENRTTGIEGRNTQFLALRDCPISDLNNCLYAIKTLDNSLSAKFTGFFSFWHKMFSVKKNAVLLMQETEHFPSVLKDCSTDSEYGIYSSPRDFRGYKDLFDQIDRWRNLIDNILRFRKELSNEQNRYQKAKATAENLLQQLAEEKSQKEGELSATKESLPPLLELMEQGKGWIRDNGLNMLKSYILHYMKSRDSVSRINDYKGYLPDQIPWKDVEYGQFDRRTKDFLDIFRLCSVTSLSAKSAFPLVPELFDMIVIDEASQCDVASALPLIMRTKQLVVIGDPMQLRHISAVAVEEEKEIKRRLGLEERQYVKYAECSLYDYCKDYISHGMNGQTVPYMLRFHYRCHPAIIGYSNDLFYGGKMGSRLEVRTDTGKLLGNPRGIVLVDVKGKQMNGNVNVNMEEAKKSIELAVLEAQADPFVSIGIVTPFRHQAEKINKLIPEEYADRIEANTVHKYQGDEKDIIIYSLVVTSNSPDGKIHWIDNKVPNLVNVAVTRARSTLYVVGNIDYIRAHSRADMPLGNLVRYNDNSLNNDKR